MHYHGQPWNSHSREAALQLIHSSHNPPSKLQNLPKESSKCQYTPKTRGNFNTNKAGKAPDGLKSQSKKVFDIQVGRTHNKSQYVKQSSSKLQLLFRNTMKQSNHANNFELRAFKGWHRTQSMDLNQPTLQTF